MKKILIAVLAAMNVSAYAEDPNYDTSSGIVTIPKVTVDKSSTFVNVELFLNPNGTWQILRAEPSSHVEIKTLSSKYIDNTNGTITDKTSDLIWDRCALGQSWSEGKCLGEPRLYTYDEIKNSGFSYAGRSDWRVPNLDELKTLVYCSSGQPSAWPGEPGSWQTSTQCSGSYSSPVLDEVAFPNTPSEFYLTSTAAGSGFFGNPIATDNIYAVDFGTGESFVIDKSTPSPVRLVRGPRYCRTAATIIDCL